MSPRRAEKKDFASFRVSNGGVAIGPTATSIPVVSAADAPTGGPFTIRYVPSGAVVGEIIRVLGVSGNVFTPCTRGLPEGDAATTIPDGSLLSEIWGAQDIADVEDYIPPLDASNITSGTISSARLPANVSSIKKTGSSALNGDVTLTGGTGVTLTQAGQDISIAATGSGSGTVTSVALSLPAEFTVSGSPVTGSGTLTAVRSNQTANTVQAGPATGAPAAPTFRALVQGDIPALDASQITTGALAKARQNVNTAYTDVATTFAAEVTTPDLKVTGLTGSVQATRMVGATTSGAPLSGPHLVGDVSLSLADGKYYVCTVAGTPGTFVTPSGGGSGTVTSVGLSAPGTLFSVAGTPIISSGTLSLSLIAQNANKVLAGPASGVDAVPTVRALVSADLPVATSSLYGAMKPDGVTTSVSGGIISATGASAPVGSYNANAQPAIPPDSVSLIDRFRGGAQTVVGAIQNEFDLQYYNGVYYLAHDNGTNTILTHGSTVAAALSASTDATIATRYPSILFDGTTWHLWGMHPSFTNVQHYTASTFAGSYTLVDSPAFAQTPGDPQVRLNPLDGAYYMTLSFGTAPTAKIHLLKATSPGGTWTDLGAIFSVIGDPPYAPNQFDSTPVFWNGRAYVVFSCTDSSISYAGSHSHLCMVELDPSTMKAIGAAAIILDSLETSGLGYTPAEMSNPIFLGLPGQPGQEKIYVDAASGLVSISVGPPLPDGRRREDGLRLNSAVGLDHASGLIANAHGGATWGPYGLTAAATPSGAYGFLNRPALTDFTLAIAFSLPALPGANGLLLRASPSAMGANEASLRVTSGGVLQGQVIGSSTLILTGTTTLVANTVYRAILRRIGSEVRLYLGTNQEAIGTQADAFTGLTEWSVANDKGASQAAGEQLLCSVFGAAVCGEALPLSADPLVGMLTNAPYQLPIASTTALGGMKPDGVTTTADGSGIVSAIVYAPLTSGAEPIELVSNGVGGLVLVSVS